MTNLRHGMARLGKIQTRLDPKMTRSLGKVLTKEDRVRQGLDRDNKVRTCYVMVLGQG